MIQIDRREQKNQHIEKRFDELGVQYYGFSLPVGDYAVMNDHHISVDKKGGLQEVYSNIVQQHDRFMNECRLAKEAGIKLIILIEEDGVHSLDEVCSWKNPRRVEWENIEEAHRQGRMLGVKNRARPPMNSLALASAMRTIANETGVEWRFTTHERIAEDILDLLGVETK